MPNTFDNDPLDPRNLLSKALNRAERVAGKEAALIRATAIMAALAELDKQDIENGIPVERVMERAEVRLTFVIRELNEWLDSIEFS